MTQPDSTPHDHASADPALPASTTAAASTPAVDTRTASRALLQYSVLRLGLFFIVVVVLRLAGIRDILGLMLALLITSVLGFFLLKKQRDTYAVALEARMAERRQTRTDLRARLDEGQQPDPS